MGSRAQRDDSRCTTPGTCTHGIPGDVEAAFLAQAPGGPTRFPHDSYEERQGGEGLSRALVSERPKDGEAKQQQETTAPHAETITR
jgi:hypothetical protein